MGGGGGGGESGSKIHIFLYFQVFHVGFIRLSRSVVEIWSLKVDRVWHFPGFAPKNAKEAPRSTIREGRVRSEFKECTT